MDNSKNKGLLGLLGILFIGLKLTGYINWDWWIVLLPFYALAIVLIIMVLIIVIGGVIVAIVNPKK